MARRKKAFYLGRKAQAHIGRAYAAHHHRVQSAVRARNVAVLRKEYCAARTHYDRTGKALGMLTGTHKKKSRHRRRHTVCRSSR